MDCQRALECLLASNGQVAGRPDDRVRNAFRFCVWFSARPAGSWRDGSDVDYVAGERDRLCEEASSDSAGR